MIIYVNERYEIVALNKEPLKFYKCYEMNQTKEEVFGSMCDTVISGYKYEPQYEFLFNEGGSNARDKVTGELLYKLDEKGNKKFNGYFLYPFINDSILMLIQKQYEESQKQVQAMNAQMAYLSMMSGIETEVHNE
ncbi:hypothetical protein ABFV83_02370 [Lacrimispora sp. BS-2]|uniref:Uncharacterized protein n=1 Tax=Lacrimispora sp. BS-2 TaxID=3151850 RepID=A0AAU7PQW5_9FIRM